VWIRFENIRYLKILGLRKLKHAQDQFRLLGFLPKKVHFCLISVTEHTVFTKEYIFLNCSHTGNMSRQNFRNLSRLITTTDNGKFQVH